MHRRCALRLLAPNAECMMNYKSDKFSHAKSPQIANEMDTQANETIDVIKAGPFEPPSSGQCGDESFEIAELSRVTFASDEAGSLAPMEQDITTCRQTSEDDHMAMDEEDNIKSDFEQTNKLLNEMLCRERGAIQPEPEIEEASSHHGEEIAERDDPEITDNSETATPIEINGNVKDDDDEPKDDEQKDEVPENTPNLSQAADESGLGRNRRIRQKNRYFLDFHCMELTKGGRSTIRDPINQSTSGLSHNRGNKRAGADPSSRGANNLVVIETKYCRKCSARTAHEVEGDCQVCLYDKIVESTKRQKQSGTKSRSVRHKPQSQQQQVQQKSLNRPNQEEDDVPCDVSQSSIDKDTNQHISSPDTSPPDIQDEMNDVSQFIYSYCRKCSKSTTHQEGLCQTCARRKEAAEAKRQRRANNRSRSRSSRTNSQNQDSKRESPVGLPQEAAERSPSADQAPNVSEAANGHDDASSTAIDRMDELIKNELTSGSMHHDMDSQPASENTAIDCVDSAHVKCEFQTDVNGIHEDARIEEPDTKQSAASLSSDRTANTIDSDDKHSNSGCQSLRSLDAWTPQDVADYFTSRGFDSEAEIFIDQSVDGISLMLMQRADFTNGLKLKLGPALKIYEQVCRLKRDYFRGSSSLAPS